MNLLYFYSNDTTRFFHELLSFMKTICKPDCNLVWINWILQKKNVWYISCTVWIRTKNSPNLMRKCICWLKESGEPHFWLLFSFGLDNVLTTSNKKLGSKRATSETVEYSTCCLYAAYCAYFVYCSVQHLSLCVHAFEYCQTQPTSCLSFSNIMIGEKKSSTKLNIIYAACSGCSANPL